MYECVERVLQIFVFGLFIIIKYLLYCILCQILPSVHIFISSWILLLSSLFFFLQTHIYRYISKLQVKDQKFGRIHVVKDQKVMNIGNQI